jgi:hypothetical protein
MHTPFFDFILEDKDLGRAMDAARSIWDEPSGNTWSSADPLGI